MRTDTFDAGFAFGGLLAMPETLFLVPRAAASSPQEWRAWNVTAKRVDAQVGLLKVPSWLVILRGGLSGRETRFLNLIKLIFAADSQETFETIPVRVGDHFHLMVLRVNVDYIVNTVERQAEVNSRQHRAEVRACAAYSNLLRRLAQVTGRSVTFHHGRAGVQLPNLDREGIHIYTNSYPVGLNNANRPISAAFGLNLTEDGREVVARHPTLGRGVVMKDGDEQDMIQVVDNNWYLLLPTMSHFNESTSLEIFERLLALGLEASERRSVMLKQSGRRDYLTGMKTNLGKRARHFEDRVKEAEVQIERLQRQLLMEEQKLREFILMRDAWRKYEAGQFRRLGRKRDFERLVAHPLIDRFYLIDDGFLQICTKPIVIEHEGRLYRMGKFIITLNGWQEVGMHCVHSPHPRGVQHVHIGASGDPCFGNAGRAITEALADFRIADAIYYMLSWLTQGYSPELAEVKIEEWPLVSDEPAGEGA